MAHQFIPTPDQSEVLSSWKDIANYTGAGVRTVQRWEKVFGLPVLRPAGSSTKSQILVRPRDLDACLAARAARHRSRGDSTRNGSNRHSSGLAETIRKSRELTSTGRTLAHQIDQSVRKLTETCEALAKSK